MPRFALLEHRGAPDDPAGRHYDLLVEAGDSCRTWRLTEVPRIGGQPVPAVELSPHRLAWLDHEAGPVSAGRGFARRVDGGPCAVVTESPRIELAIAGRVLRGRLVLVPSAAGWDVRLVAGDV